MVVPLKWFQKTTRLKLILGMGRWFESSSILFEQLDKNQPPRDTTDDTDCERTDGRAPLLYPKFCHLFGQTAKGPCSRRRRGQSRGNFWCQMRLSDFRNIIAFAIVSIVYCIFPTSNLLYLDLGPTFGHGRTAVQCPSASDRRIAPRGAVRGNRALECVACPSASLECFCLSFGHLRSGREVCHCQLADLTWWKSREGRGSYEQIVRMFTICS